MKTRERLTFFRNTRPRGQDRRARAHGRQVALEIEFLKGAAEKRDYIRHHRPHGVSVAKGCRLMGPLRSTYYDAPPVKADDTEPSVSAVSIGRLSKSAPCLAERPHASCDARLDWGASHSLAAQSGKVSERQTLRNEGKFGPHFKGQFWKRHL